MHKKHRGNYGTENTLQKNMRVKNNSSDGMASRHIKLALISWAFINNNMISTPLYTIFILLDYTLQLLIILCLYQTFNAIDLDFTNITKIIEAEGYENVQTGEQIGILVYCVNILAVGIILVFKNNKEQNFNEKRILFKIISFQLVLLRSFLFTAILLILACNTMIFQDTETMRIAKISILTSAYILMGILSYYQAHFFNLTVPNSILSWSETSFQTYLLECLYKTFLAFTFSNRDTLALKYTFLGLTVIVLGYKIGFKLIKSIQFNMLVHKVKLVGDLVMFTLILLLIPAELNANPQYIYVVMITLPFPLLLAWYFLIRLRHYQSIHSEIDDQSGTRENSRLINFHSILEKYMNASQINGNTSASFQTRSLYTQALSEIQYNHLMKCKTYARRLDKKLHSKQLKKIKIEEQDSDGDHQEELIKGNQKGHQYQTSNVDEELKSDFENHSVDIGLKHNSILNKQLSNTNLSVFNLKSQDDNLSSYYNINYQSKSSQKQQCELTRKSKKEKQLLKQSKNNRNKNFNMTAMLMLDNQNSGVNILHHKSSHENLIKKFKKLILHFFKQHLIHESGKDFRLQALRIYFTQKVMNNHFLAHFLLFNFTQKQTNENFVTRNKKVMHQKLFENELLLRNNQEDSLGQVDLQNMLDLNQLLAKFESQLESVSLDIQKFWQNLLGEKEIQQIYSQGIRISESIKDMMRIYNDIEVKQSEQKEVKVYSLMSSFFKYVLFKQDEYIQEQNKFKQAIQTRKLANVHKDKSMADKQKGMLIADLDLRKPMEISFINKTLTKMTKYDSNEIVGMRINQIMPQILSENHHKFIEKFMQTGKYGMLNQRKELFLKQKTGYVIPIITFLSINHLDLRKMILLVEYMETFSPFDDEFDQQQQVGIILANKKLEIFEINKALTRICGLTLPVLDQYRNQFARTLTIDDLFTLSERQNSNGFSDIQTLIDEGRQIFTVEFAIESTIQGINKDNNLLPDLNLKFESQGIHHQKSIIFTTKYQMKIQTYKFLHSQVELRVFSLIKEIATDQNQENFKYPTYQPAYKQYALTTTAVAIADNDDIVFNQKNNGKGNQQQTSTQGLRDLKDEYSISKAKQSSSNSRNYDLSSQTSTSSSAISGMQQINIYSTSINSQSIPTTLRFVLQIVLIVIFLVIATSTVSLVLTMSNFSEAQDGINVSNLAIRRLNCITEVRLLVRGMFSVANEQYKVSNGSLLTDRYVFYGYLITEISEILRTTQIQIDALDEVTNVENFLVDLKFLSGYNERYTQQRTLQQSIIMYTGYSDDMIIQLAELGNEVLKSKLDFFAIANEDLSVATAFERQGFFLIENGNQNIYDKVNQYTREFKKLIIDSVQRKVDFQAAMTWICIAIIFVSGFIIIPLFGRIQNRILILMKLFFEIRVEVKQSMISKIKKFHGYIEWSKVRENQLNEEDEQSMNMKYTATLKLKTKIKGPIEHSPEQNDKGSKMQPRQLKSNQHLIEEDFDDIKKRNYSPEEVKDQDDDDDYDFEDQPEESKEKSQVSSNNKKKHKKRKGKHRKHGSSDDESKAKIKNKSQASMQSAADLAVLKYFQNFITKKKLKQALAIIIISIAFSAYFLGTYFMSTSDFQEMQENIENMFILFQRKGCVLNMIHAVRETYISNKAYYVNDGQDEILEYFTKYCYQLEFDYQQKIRKPRPTALAESYELLDQLEDGTFCGPMFDQGEDFFSGILNVTTEICETYLEGIAKTGLTNTFQSIYRLAQMLDIDYEQNAEKYPDGIPDDISIDKISSTVEIFDALETIFYKPLIVLQNQAVESISNHFNKQSLSFILIYAVFIVFTVLLIIIFLSSKFKQVNIIRHFPKFKKGNATLKQITVYFGL